MGSELQRGGPDGRAAPGTALWIIAPGVRQQHQCDAHGKLEIYDLPPGREYSVWHDPWCSESVRVHSDAWISIELRRPPPACLSVLVVDPKGRPAANARVRLLDSGVAIGACTTGSHGRCQLTGSGGDLRIEAEHVTGEASAERNMLAPGQHDVRLQLRPPAPNPSVRLEVHVVDPQGYKEGKDLLPGVSWQEDPYKAMRNAEAVILLTEWNEFRALDLKRMAKRMTTPIMADLRNIYTSKDVKQAGFTAYASIGREGFGVE